MPLFLEKDLGIFEFFWLGFTFLIASLGLLQIFYPLNGMILGVCFLMGFIGHFLNKEQKSQEVNFLYLTMLFIVILAVSLPCVSVDGTLSFSYDTGLYHLSVVRWINEYATVPGLANLHTRLGYGSASSFFTFAALFDNWIWDGRSAWLTVSFLLAMLLAQVLHKLFFGTTRLKIYSLICFLYLLLELLLLRPGLYFDSVVFYILIIAGLHAVEMTGAGAKFNEMAEKKYFAFYIVPSMLTLAFTIKPVAVIVLLCCAVIYGMPFFQSLYRSDRKNFPKITAVAIVPLLLLSGYLLRNLMTSGWPLFPAPYGGIAVQWSLPKETVENEYRVIKNWPRASGHEFLDVGDKLFYEWAPSWLFRNFDKFNGVTFFLPLFFAFVMVLWYLMQKKRCKFHMIIFFTLFLSLIFWFFTGPDIRFARGFVWLLVAFLVLAFYDTEGWGFSVLYNFIPRHTLRVITVAVAIEGILLFCVVLPYRNFKFSLWHIGRAASRPVKSVTLNNGQTPSLVVWVPEESDRCGDAPLPCTPYPDDRLRLFVPGDLGKGFYLKRE
jgi:hypothetical protein